MKILTSGQATTAGGKAYHLLELKQAGFLVPNFQILSFDWFQTKESLTWLRQKNKQLSDRKFESLSRELRETARLSLRKELDLALLTSFSANKLYAVRSSATVEDGQVHSFAGRFETYLNVSHEDLLEAIENCLLSLYTPSALHYFLEKEVPLQDAKMVVIVQEMVASSLSGIYFTASPLGAINEHQIVLGSGLGDAVVEDRIPTTMVTYHPKEGLTSIQKSPNSPVVTDQHIKKLTDCAKTLITTFGPYLDIEFAFEQEELYLLQVRPITTIKTDQLIILDNSNIVESYPGLSSPLTISFVQEAYSSIFRSLAKRLVGSNNHILAAYEPVFQNMVSPINSRLYYQIQNWYQLLHLLPFSKQIIPIWQDMLGISDLNIPDSKQKISLLDKIGVAWRILRAFHRSHKAMKELEQEFQTVEAFFHNHYQPENTIDQQEKLYQTLHESILANWDLTLINDLYAFVHVGFLKKITGSEVIQSDIAGIEAIESMKPALALEKIQETLNNDPEIQMELHELLQLTEAELTDRLTVADSFLTQSLVDFIHLYGDRAPEELKLETKTFRSHPSTLLNYLRQEKCPQLQYSTEQISSKQRRTSFIGRWLKKRALTGISYRESSRLNRTRIYGMVRQIFRGIGQDLAHQNIIDQADDIFYLTKEEIFSHQDTLSFHQLIANRKAKMLEDQEITLPRRLIFNQTIVEKKPSQTNHLVQEHSDKLRGIGCSEGIVEGEVLIVETIQDLPNLQNKILITKMTDPGWIYALMQAKGVIAEQGSLLSHTAIISRELGIPSIVNVPHVTKVLQTGEKIEMDGTTGIIRRLNHDRN